MVETILDYLLKKENVRYEITENNLILIYPEQKSRVSDVKSRILVNDATQQKRTLTGIVVDDRGEPVIGANVMEKGTINGNITDVNGKFTLSVLNNAVLQVSYIGYLSQEVAMGNQTTLTITLRKDTKALEEVVVVGYGTQKKGNLTGSIATLKAEEMVVAPVASTTNALAGRLPGLISLQSSGQPGSDAASLSIRGFGGTLVIVDGIEAGFNTIDPNQIETISILKDGSASIYGSRAGNGVILVTTKRGKEQKPTITLNMSYTLQGVTNMPKTVNAGQYAEMAREEWIQSGRPEATAPYTAEQIRKYYESTDPQYPNTDWYDVLIRDWAPQQQHNLSVGGGSDKIKYYGFLGYMDQQTMFKKNGGDYNRYNLQSNIDAKITESLTFQLDLSAIFNSSVFSTRGLSAGDNTVWQDLWNTLPTYPATLPDPTKISWADGMGTGGAHVSSNYELFGTNRNNSQNLKGTGVLTYKFKAIEGLSAKLFVNYMRDYSKNSTFSKPVKFYRYDVLSDTYILAGSLGSQAQMRVSQSQSSMLTTQLSLSYDRYFNVDHHLALMALYEGIDYGSEWFNAGRDGYMSTAIEQLFAGNSETATNGGAANEMGRSSFVGRLNYSFKNKYLLEATLRADASAKFTPEKRWGYFPSVSLGWRLSEEGFLNTVSVIDDLKLRASYGSSGYDGVGNFQYLSGYAISGNYLLGGSTQQGIQSTGMANPDLTWEKIKIYNAGIDWSLLSRTLYGTAEIFYRTRSGIPGNRLATLPNTFGASLPSENLNSLNDRGFELVLGTVQTYGDFTYDINGNISWSRAKWDHYEEQERTDPDENRLYTASGKWTDRRIGYRSDGLFTSQAEIDALSFDQDLRGNSTLRPGDIRYIDVNKDEKLDWRDQVVLGPGTTPHWMSGINLNVKYKNFDLSTLFQGAFGYYTHVVLLHGNKFNSEQIYNLRWTESNNDAHALIPRLGGANTNNLTSDYRLKSAGYLRIKTVAIGYNLPSELLNQANIQQARIYLSGTNLLTFDKLRKYNIDPEMPDGQGGYYYPQQRTISIGLNVSF
ncbi:MAG: TonB-dependent receptor SusC [Candidatus Ordinivivax streblomastigis]|uniref:TonB-dependent receptor SusC n=1 Tax=Candidatus Ordinivivax streblomastigis TaxID=2540710 RepID=A0A5M8NYD4_9BACT|nr:MAG: TonB-dependent receptor SusC [Candidatus Ordinivivax streblomastigis]